MSAQPRAYPTGNSNNAAPDPRLIVLTADEENFPERAILAIIAQIEDLPIAANPQNTGHLRTEVELYKRIEAIIAFKKIRLEASIQSIEQAGGARKRRRTRRRS